MCNHESTSPPRNGMATGRIYGWQGEDMAGKMVTRAQNWKTRMFDLSSKPVQSLSFEDVRRFCEQQVREGEDIEYKGNLSGKAEKERIARTVSSFANNRGGIVLYGVVPDSNDSALPEASPNGQPLVGGRDARSRILLACETAIFPPIIPEISEFLYDQSDPSSGFLIVRVPTSDTMHAVGQGRDTIIRMGDNSVAATGDMITEQRSKKQAAILRHARRRAVIVEKLNVAENLVQKSVRVWVSIGPTVHLSPLLTSVQLSDGQLMSRVTSYSWNMRFPLDPRFTIKGLAEAAYFIDAPICDHVGAIDLDGNVILFSSMPKQEDFSRLHPLDQMHLQHRPSNSNVLVTLWARMLMERILTALRSVQLIHCRAGFVGLLSLNVRIEQARDLVLMMGNERRRGRPGCVLGVCGESVVEVEKRFNSSDLRDEDGIRHALWPVADQLLTTWGNNEHEARDYIIEQAEIDHYGGESCGCGLFLKPTINARCRTCAGKLNS